MFKTDKTVQKKHLSLAILMFFNNKGFKQIILHTDHAKYILSDKLKIDEPPFVVYSHSKTMRKQILNYKESVTNGDTTYDLGRTRL